MLGVIAIAKSRIEPVEEISDRLRNALEHIDSDRLISAPDCGLGFLSRDLALAKLANMVTAAKVVG
jgi:5-methyltetrahydropteroyltriglutamate--homocysteine methyltransferase